MTLPALIGKFVNRDLNISTQPVQDSSRLERIVQYYQGDSQAIIVSVGVVHHVADFHMVSLQLVTPLGDQP